MLHSGRYSDSDKMPQKYASWDLSLKAFEDERYFDALINFLDYLSDEQEGNVFYEKANSGIRFKFYQGSKSILGEYNGSDIVAYTKVAKVLKQNVAILRKVMEQNFNLKYCRYALDDDGDMVMLFDTSVKDSSPYKLYYALKEMSTTADKNDDLLIEEFTNNLQPIDTTHIIELSEKEKNAKYAFLTEQLGQILRTLDEKAEVLSKYPGASTYLLLNVVYKLDFLLRPEGFMMEKLEFIHRTYFASDKKPIQEKNNFIRAELEELQRRDPADYFKEFYRTRNTFGITAAASTDRLRGVIDNELNNMNWYMDHDYNRIAQAIPGYIIGYCLFNFSPPKPAKQLFKLYYRIVEWPFFEQLGFSNDFRLDDGSLDKRSIKRAINGIEEENKEIFPYFDPQENELDFATLTKFSKSFLLMIRNSDMTRIREIK